MPKISFTFWKGVKNTEELRAYLETNGDLPECEMFKKKSAGDDERIKGLGFIEPSTCDDDLFNDDLFNELPETLSEALGD